MESRIDGLLSRRRHSHLEDGFKGDKVVNEVLDRPAVMTIYNMIKSGVISGVIGALRAGKESVVFRARGPSGEDVALKVYLVTTSSFKRRAQYIEGDPRFSRIRGGTRNMVKMWARKEHANLRLCHARGLPVPMPLHVSDNVLAMEFVGDDGMPAHTLLESETCMADHGEIMGIVRAHVQGGGARPWRPIPLQHIQDRIRACSIRHGLGSGQKAPKLLCLPQKRH
ncbi:serine/threonine protein kinase [Cenarchaeum symbiosum A]|uniref:non-specific serine/threonine protein kinase n=1 Tax=Cenarchaeum symbiosum (strain A) TaxID=414004 RepID=A0RVP6_CENSY|nr:serine/threonine protein kinase [Cenarchaeum symbiosum A]